MRNALKHLLPVGTRSILWGAHCWFIHPWFVALAWWRLFGFPRDWRLWVAFFVHDLGYVGKPNMDGDEGERHVEWGANLMHKWFDRGAVPGHWKIVEGESGEMLHATWSIQTEDGLWFSCAHYPNTGWGQCAIESQVREWTQEGRTPGWFGEWKIPASQPNAQWRDFCLYHSRFYSKRDAKPFSRLCVADKLAVALEPWWLYLPRAWASGEVWEYFEAAGGNPGSKYAGEPHVGSHTQNAPKTLREWFARMSDYMRAWAYEHRDGREDTWTPELR